MVFARIVQKSGIAGISVPLKQGHIQNVDILILDDSGSTHSFLNSRIASQMQGFTVLPKEIRVAVANGETLSCQSQMLSAEWSMQDCVFSCDLKLILLHCYDLILGMD